MLRVTLPEPMEAFVEESVRSGRFRSATEVLCAALELLRQQDEREQKRAELEAELLKGLDSPSRVMTEGDWETLKEQAHARHLAPRTK
jgi:putative addiction module CopG family antidote